VLYLRRQIDVGFVELRDEKLDLVGSLYFANRISTDWKTFPFGGRGGLRKKVYQDACFSKAFFLAQLTLSALGGPVIMERKVSARMRRHTQRKSCST
jgi:hypothetical protein